MQNENHLRTMLAINQLQPLLVQDIEQLMELLDKNIDLTKSSRPTLQKMGFSPKFIQSFKNLNWHTIEHELKWSHIPNHHILTITQDSYPKRLKEIKDPPLLLYAKGDISCLNEPGLAMVGSRNPTLIGSKTAFDFAQYLAASGLIITSGLAIGIDESSHKGALLTGKTLAILGSGLEHIYPKRNHQLAEQIVDNGALISEFPLDSQPSSWHFPLRNRIISGLSLGVLVVEAALRSGSLISARLAGNQGREIFAIPGSIHNPLSKGCHKLIQEGAKLVETAQDILDELPKNIALTPPDQNSVKSETNKKLPLSKALKQLLSAIGDEPTHTETLIERTQLTPQTLSSQLLALELKGYIKATNGRYMRTKS